MTDLLFHFHFEITPQAVEERGAELLMYLDSEGIGKIHKNAFRDGFPGYRSMCWAPVITSLCSKTAVMHLLNFAFQRMRLSIDSNILMYIIEVQNNAYVPPEVAQTNSRDDDELARVLELSRAEFQSSNEQVWASTD